MVSATLNEFEAVRAWRFEKRNMPSKRSQYIVWTDQGTEVASKLIVYRRGQVHRTSYMINPSYLPPPHEAGPERGDYE